MEIFTDYNRDANLLCHPGRITSISIFKVARLRTSWINHRDCHYLHKTYSEPLESVVGGHSVATTYWGGVPSPQNLGLLGSQPPQKASQTQLEGTFILLANQEAFGSTERLHSASPLLRTPLRCAHFQLHSSSSLGPPVMGSVSVDTKLADEEGLFYLADQRKQVKTVRLRIRSLWFS